MTEETAAKIVYHLLAMVAGFALCILLTAAWDWGLVPRKIVSTGTVTTKDGRVLETRRYQGPADLVFIGDVPHFPVNQSRYDEELRLPSGRWIPCGRNCLRAFERVTR